MTGLGAGWCAWCEDEYFQIFEIEHHKKIVQVYVMMMLMSRQNSMKKASTYVI
jgi:hypothetical protein